MKKRLIESKLCRIYDSIYGILWFNGSWVLTMWRTGPFRQNWTKANDEPDLHRCKSYPFVLEFCERNQSNKIITNPSVFSSACVFTRRWCVQIRPRGHFLDCRTRNEIKINYRKQWTMNGFKGGTGSMHRHRNWLRQFITLFHFSPSQNQINGKLV